jgi:hypothetical protein
MKKVTNLNTVIEEFLEQGMTYEDIGKIFIQSTNNIINNNMVSIDFANYDEMHPAKKNRFDSTIINHLRFGFSSVYTGKRKIPKYDIKIVNPVNKFSENIAKICDYMGPESYTTIGEVVHKAAKDYVENNTQALETNFHRNREYKSISDALTQKRQNLEK